MARPKEKLVKRDTLILRDVPEDTDREKLKALFGDSASHITEMKPGNSPLPVRVSCGDVRSRWLCRVGECGPMMLF